MNPKAQYPVEITRGPNIPGMIMGTLFSIVWFGFCSVFLAVMISADTPGEVYVFFSLFMLAGIFPLVGAVKSGERTYIRGDASQIHYKRRRVLLKTVEWSEKTSSFKGVFIKTYSVKSGKNSRRVVYGVELVHPDTKKNILLAQCGNELQQRQSSEHYSKLLGLKLLVPGTEGEMIEVASEDADLTLKERVEKGTVKTGELKPYPAGSKYVFEKIENGFQLTRHYTSTWIYGFPIVFIGIILLVSLPAAAPGIVLVVIGGFFLGTKGAFQRLMVTPSEIRAYQTFAGRELMTRSVKTAEVEEVRLGHDESRGNVKRFNASVMIMSDNGIIHFAHGSSEEERNWIRDAVMQYVIAVQSKA